jgi:60 kDa SS-A/Ro ribonucleoprotein
MTDYASHVQTRVTPQRESARADQVQNNAGGYAFQVDDWGRLARFLILGASGGSYYATERALTREAAAAVEACLKLDPARAIETIASVSETGRAPKNDPAIFALALATASESAEAKRLAYAAIPRVCRTGTHLFQFAGAVDQLRGWGRGLRTAVGRWYSDRPAGQLAYQVAKYQSRERWSHRDVLRLSHAPATTPEHNAIYRWCVGGLTGFGPQPAKGGGVRPTRGVVADPAHLPTIILAMEETKKLAVDAAGEKRLVELIRENRLTHEMVPNDFKKSPKVWEALLAEMPLGAMVRNLGRMSSIGLLAPLSDASKIVCDRLGDGALVTKSLLHPIAFLSALRTYQSGHGVRGSLTWTAVPAVNTALESAFYAAFGNVEPSNKNTLIALDVSGSMDWHELAQISGLTPRVASAAMAMVTTKVEPYCHSVAFTSGASTGMFSRDVGLTNLDLSKHRGIEDVCQMVRVLPAGGTDCALPIVAATKNKWQVDTFIVYTDSETWAGAIHPFQAIREYRQKSGRAAKLIVVGMESNGFTIADPSDAGMLDVVGFDSAAPAVMSAFARGAL